MNKKISIIITAILIAILAKTTTNTNLLNYLISILLIPTCDKSELKFSTQSSKLPDNVIWNQQKFAKELINLLEGVVVISGGSNSIKQEEWSNFKPSLPWIKNINRNLLFNKSYFIRSPDKKSNCSNDCFSQREYDGYTWIDLAKPICVNYIPNITDNLKPAKGHLVIKTILKCHSIYYEDFIYELTDNKGNYYAMHAYEENEPNLNVELPFGFTLNKVKLTEPLIIAPFGGNDLCYHNIVGDNLGQGYHQFKFSNTYYP